MVKYKQFHILFLIGFLFVVLTITSREARDVLDHRGEYSQSPSSQSLSSRKEREPASSSTNAQKVQFVVPTDIARSLSPNSAMAINAAAPFSLALNPPAVPFILKADEDDRERAVQCLTQAVYYEAGFEPSTGQEAVAQVVLNRLRHPIFPKSVCGVVFQGATLKTGCQFSFTCDGSLNRIPQAAAWARCKMIAEQALDGFVLKSVGQATHYHTQWVVPWWRPTVLKVAQIGAHIFYRWPGSLGLPGAFNGRYAGHEEIAILLHSTPKMAGDDQHAPILGPPPTSPYMARFNETQPSVSPRQRMLALSARRLLGRGAAFENEAPQMLSNSQAAAADAPSQ